LLPDQAKPGKIRAVLGLGNPGREYERTRHNAGFLVVDRIRREAGARWSHLSDRDEAEVALPSGPLLLARPRTYMNLSGAAAASLMLRRGLTPEEILVVLDDAALPEGRLRLRPRGGDGGHRGLESILRETSSEEFPRLRVGIGAPGPAADLADFVLDPLDGESWERFQSVIARAAEAVELLLREGLSAAMNRFNPAPPPPDEESKDRKAPAPEADRDLRNPPQPG